MGNPAEMQKETRGLANQVKQLQEEKVDLQRRLAECERRLTETSGEWRVANGEWRLIARSIAHDMRSGLGIIRNMVHFVEEDLDQIDRPDLLTIFRSLDFCELVLRNLSALGGQEVSRPRRVDLETVVRKVFYILERKLVDVELEIEPDPDGSQILADEGQMEQVFMNLIQNAGEAMPDGGKLTFRARREGGMLRVEMHDTGRSIWLEDQERPFQELLATKDQGRGWGLHIVHTIVQRHGGAIRVESKGGKGTTFVLHLPIEAGDEND